MRIRRLDYRDHVLQFSDGEFVMSHVTQKQLDVRVLGDRLLLAPACGGSGDSDGGDPDITLIVLNGADDSSSHFIDLGIAFAMITGTVREETNWNGVIDEDDAVPAPAASGEGSAS